MVESQLDFERRGRVEGVVDVDLEIGEFGKQTDFVEFEHVAFDEGMAEGWGVVGLEIAEFLEESRNLDDNSENIFIRRMIVHAETLNCLVVFDDRIKSFFF